MKQAALAVLLLLLITLIGWPVYNTRVLVIRHEEVRIPSGDIELAATISVPRWGSAKCPALVSVHGSGPRLRQDYTSDWRRLVPAGIVVLTYDKRGVGESSGHFEEVRRATSEEQLRTLAADARACFELLKRHPRVDPQKIGYFGASQAGWIIPLANDGQTDVAFNIIMSGAATSYGLEMYYSELTGDGIRPSQGLSRDEIDRRLRAYDGVTGFDPLPVLPRVRAPSLWLLGAEDLSTPVDRSVENLRKLQAQGVPITLTVYPNANHGLADASTGTPLPYWADMLDWLDKRVGLKH